MSSRASTKRASTRRDSDDSESSEEDASLYLPAPAPETVSVPQLSLPTPPHPSWPSMKRFSAATLHDFVPITDLDATARQTADQLDISTMDDDATHTTPAKASSVQQFVRAADQIPFEYPGSTAIHQERVAALYQGTVEEHYATTFQNLNWVRAVRAALSERAHMRLSVVYIIYCRMIHLWLRTASMMRHDRYIAYTLFGFGLCEDVGCRELTAASSAALEGFYVLYEQLAHYQLLGVAGGAVYHSMQRVFMVITEMTEEAIRLGTSSRIMSTCQFRIPSLLPDMVTAYAVGRTADFLPAIVPNAVANATFTPYRIQKERVAAQLSEEQDVNVRERDYGVHGLTQNDCDRESVPAVVGWNEAVIRQASLPLRKRGAPLTLLGPGVEMALRQSNPLQERNMGIVDSYLNGRELTELQQKQAQRTCDELLGAVGMGPIVQVESVGDAVAAEMAEVAEMAAASASVSEMLPPNKRGRGGRGGGGRGGGDGRKTFRKQRPLRVTGPYLAERKMASLVPAPPPQLPPDPRHMWGSLLPMQRLAYRAWMKAASLGYWRREDYFYRERSIVINGRRISTRAFERVEPVSEFIGQLLRVENYDMHMDAMTMAQAQERLSRHMTIAFSDAVPFAMPHRNLFSFANGMYCSFNGRFYPWSDASIPSRGMASRYVPRPNRYPNIGFAQEIADLMNAKSRVTFEHARIDGEYRSKRMRTNMHGLVREDYDFTLWMMEHCQVEGRYRLLPTLRAWTMVLEEARVRAGQRMSARDRRSRSESLYAAIVNGGHGEEKGSEDGDAEEVDPLLGVGAGGGRGGGGGDRGGGGGDRGGGGGDRAGGGGDRAGGGEAKEAEVLPTTTEFLKRHRLLVPANKNVLLHFQKLLIELDDAKYRLWVERENDGCLYVPPERGEEAFTFRQIELTAVNTILDAQDIPESARMWIYALMGRNAFEAGQKDPWQNFLLLKGVAGSGKSTLGSLICSFYNDADVGILANQSEPKFWLQSVMNAKFLYAPEIKEDCTIDMAALLSVVSNERVSVGVKFGTAQQIFLFMYLILCMNHIPKAWKKSSAAWSRRALEIYFKNAIRPEKNDPNLKASMEDSADANLMALTHAYLIMSTLSDHDIWAVIDDYFVSRREALNAETHEMHRFLSLNAGIQVTGDENDKMPWKQFLDRFRHWCRDNNELEVPAITLDYYEAALKAYNLSKTLKREDEWVNEHGETLRENCSWLLGVRVDRLVTEGS
jgi:hypothetical protein